MIECKEFLEPSITLVATFLGAWLAFRFERKNKSKRSANVGPLIKPYARSFPSGATQNSTAKRPSSPVVANLMPGSTCLPKLLSRRG